MTFPRQRDPGLWTFDSVVTPVELENFDENLSNAIDGANGGNYSLQSDLVIGADVGVFITFATGVTFTDDIAMAGFEAHGGIWLNGTTLIDGGHLTVQSSVTTIGVSGADALVVEAFCNFNDVVNHNSEVFFNAPVSFGEDVTFDSAAHLDINSGVVEIGSTGADAFVVHSFAEFFDVTTFFGETFFDADANIAANIRFTGNGAVVHRSAAGADANTTYSPRSFKDVVILDGSITGTVNYTIDDTGCVNDNEITFSNKDQTHSMSVKRPGGTTIAGITGGWIRCKRIGGIWYGIERGDITVL